MDGVHDMGGMHGFGTVTPEKDEPVFHHEWEGRVLALNRAMRSMRAWNGDTSRYAKEVLPPHVYSSSYYKRWALGLEWLVVKYGLVGADELKARRSLRPGAAKPKLEPGAVGKQVLARGSYERPALAPALFAEGELVRAKVVHTLTHTRLPRYVRGRSGVVERVHGCHVFPDSNAAGEGENPQWVYTVRFSGRDLWGEDADPLLTVSIDAFEPYLERVPQTASHHKAQ
jgi:nitrile hydratase beta subunit